MEINYTLLRQDIYEAYMHRLKPQMKRIPVKALITAACIFLIQMCIYIVSADGLNTVNMTFSVLFTVIGFFVILFLMRYRLKRAAEKCASGISPTSESFHKSLILGEDFIQFIGDMEIKSEYSKVKSVELTEKYLYIDISGITVFLPAPQIENEKSEILEILRLKACNAVRKGF